jgi:hypothetical protein
MSFDLNDAAHIDKNKERAHIVNYYNTIVYLNQFANTPSNGGFIKMPFSKAQNMVKPNISHVSSNFTENYKSTNMYIYKKTHEIGGITYDGELIIENEMITNSSNKIYVCFLLKYGLNYNTALDKIIRASTQSSTSLQKVELDLSKLVETRGKYINYKSRDGIEVIIFPTLINVGTDLSQFKTCDLFSAYNENYMILENTQKEGFVENFKEGATSQLTCKPIFDSKDAKNSMIVSYSNSTAGNQTLTINFLFTLIIFIIMVCFANFGSPYLYKSIFIDGSETEKQVYAQTIIFLGLAGVLSFALLVDGMIYDKDVAVAGISIVTFICISALKIFDKIQNDDKIQEDKDKYMNKAKEDQNSYKKIIFDYCIAGLTACFWDGKIMSGGNATALFIFSLVGSLIFTILIGLGYFNPRGVKKVPIGKISTSSGRGRAVVAKAVNKICMIVIFGFLFTSFIVTPIVYMKFDK